MLDRRSALRNVLVAGLLGVFSLAGSSSALAAGPMQLVEVESNAPPSAFIPGWSFATPDPGGTGSFAASYGNATYSFPVPTRIESDGTTFTMSISGQGTNLAPAMVSVGGLVEGGRVDLGTHWLAGAGGAPVGSTVTAPVTLKPTGSVDASFQVNLGFSPTFTYTYEAVSCGRAVPGRSSRARAAGNEVRIVALVPDVQVHFAGCDPELWVPARKDMVLQQGDEISLDPDGLATLQFADLGTVVLRGTTQLKIASYFTKDGRDTVDLRLRRGEVLSNVKTGLALPGVSWRISTQGGVATTRGTIFAVFYDPGSRAMITTTSRGLVAVDPAGAGLRTVLVGAGKEVEVLRRSISRVVRSGTAGARGGVNRAIALKRVVALLARVNRACRITTPFANSSSVLPVARGWRVSVRVVGSRRGVARWTVIRGRLAPANALAATLSASCARR